MLLLGAVGETATLLEERGYHVLRAARADEAGLLLKRHSDILLVIADGHDGLAAVKAAGAPPWLEYLVHSGDPDLAFSAIAEAFNLARLARYQASERSDLERALQEFRTRTESAMSQLLSRARGGPSAEEAPDAAGEEMARAMEEERSRAHIREKFFGAFRLGHAGWMLLLVLAEVQGSGNELTVKSAAYAAGIPLSSALRKIGELCEDGLLHRRSDPTDNRRSFVMLTDRATTLLGAYLGAVRRAAEARRGQAG